MARSPRIAEWHSGFHRKMEALFEEQLTIELSGARRDAEAAVVTFAIEGAVTHDLDAGATADLCHSLVQRLQELNVRAVLRGRQVVPDGWANRG